MASDVPARTHDAGNARSARMPKKGMHEAGDDALPSLDTSAEVDERDYKEGQLRKAGQRTERPARERRQ